MGEEHKIRIDGITLAYQVSGDPDAPPMVLLHALGEQASGMVAYLTAMTRQDQVSRLVVEDVPLPYTRDRPLPERPPGPLPFDWAVVPAIAGQASRYDPVAWDSLGQISAPTLLIGGGPQSHIPQQLLADVAGRIPSCELVTIPAGHYVHNVRPDEFADAVLRWLHR